MRGAVAVAAAHRRRVEHDPGDTSRGRGRSAGTPGSGAAAGKARAAPGGPGRRPSSPPLRRSDDTRTS